MSINTFNLIHYGASKYNPNLFIDIQESADYPGIKPKLGGLWTSPIDSNWGWYDWCTSELFWNLDKNFILQYTGKTFIIDNIYDSKRLPWINAGRFRNGFSFIELINRGYDAIYLTENGQNETRLCANYSLYGWDCECVFIMNREKIKVF